MTWNIPFTFFAGTKAKANEVNGNFTSIKQFVDILEENTATNELNISMLENNKADINGNNMQRFQVADAIASKDAINKDTMLKYTENSQDIIRGFKLSKFNNNTITATAGTCYDSTFQFIIKSDLALTLSDSNLNANATYYVYVCGDRDGLVTPTLAFSTDATTPTVPLGYEYFRRLGRFTTDGSKNIDELFSDTEDTLIQRQSLAKTGYVKLGNGLMIQWGWYSKGQYVTPVTITYPVPFTKFSIPVCEKNGWGNTKDPDSGITGESLTGFTYYCKGSSFGVYWIAIGV